MYYKKEKKTIDPPSRRKLFKSMVAGGGAAVTAGLLPQTWTRPVVEAVLLPAHAQTTELLPPVSTEPIEGCGGLIVCQVGVDPATALITVQNLSGNNITITSIALSNPNHTQTSPVLPVVIPGNACQPLVITDSSLLCGPMMFSAGVATLSFAGFASLDVDLPT